MENSSRIAIPKTLIISAYAPPSSSGSGLMMYNLWSHVNPEQFTILTADNNTDPSLQNYRLNCRYLYYGNQTLSLQFNSRQDTILQKIKRWIKTFPVTKFIAQVVLLVALPYKIVKSARQIIKEEKTACIVGYSDLGVTLLAVYLIAVITGKPLVLYMLDLYKGNRMPFLFRLLSYWLEPRLFKKASHVIVMCDALKYMYAARYSIPLSVIYNSVEKVPGVPDEYFSTVTHEGPFKIAFFGSVYWAQKSALQTVAQAVANQLAGSVQLLLYTPHSSEFLASVGLAASDAIVHTFCPPDEALVKMRESDALLVALSSNTEYSGLINTSSPGKFSEYLISGRVILVAAPLESFIAQYTQSYKGGVVVSGNDVAACRDAITQLMANAALRESCAKAAFLLAEKNHDGYTNAQKFASVLNAVNL